MCRSYRFHYNFVRPIGKNPVSVYTAGGFYGLYNVNVVGSDEQRLLSKMEKLQEKVKSKTATSSEEKDLIDNLLPISSGPIGLEKELLPQETLTTGYHMDYFYHFDKKGKYKIEISRKATKNLNGVSFDEMCLEKLLEIEVR